MADSIHYSNGLNLIELCETSPELANDIILNPLKYSTMLRNQLDGIPTCLFLSTPLSTRHLNKIVKVSGSIIKTYPIYFKNVTTEHLCLNCNDTSQLTEQDAAKSKAAKICYACGSQNIKISQNFIKSFPTQNIRIQDMSNSRSMSETIEISIEGTKAGLFLPGDKISVTGIVMRKWKQLRVNEPMISSIYIKELQIVKDNSEDDEFSEIKTLIDEYTAKSRLERLKFIVNSFSPEIFGHENVKLGLLLAIIGGSVDNKDTGASRANSHVLLVGDLGTAKSFLLKAVSKLVSPSIFTNGVGTSDAGLTSCAVRQGKEWSLEAGALVLADNGICCIDEFNQLKVNEKGGLLEAMEQQTISVAKAGMVTSLNTRCSVLAAASTRYGYDFNRSICDNIGIASPLVTRFDLIFGIFDRNCRSNDPEIIDHIFNRYMPQKFPETIKWSSSTLKAYITQCRKKKNKIDEENCQLLLKYYTKKRSKDGVSEYNTIRMLESLVRLTEAHSKLMNEDFVTNDDAFMAIILLETCINNSSSIKFDFVRIFEDKSYFQTVKSKISLEFNLEASSL